MANYPKSFQSVTFSTATNGLSSVIDMQGSTLRSINMSTAWTTANLTFLGSASSTGALQSVRHTTANTALTQVVIAGRAVSIAPDLLAGFRWLQLRSGTTATPVAQTAARTLVLGLSPVDIK